MNALPRQPCRDELASDGIDQLDELDREQAEGDAAERQPGRPAPRQHGLPRAQGDQGQDAARRDAVEKMLEKIGHVRGSSIP